MSYGSGTWGVGVWGVDDEAGPIITDIDAPEYDPNPLSDRIDVKFKYRYLITMSRNTGGNIALGRIDAALGQELEHESASNIPPLRGNDFLESITFSDISASPDSDNVIELRGPSENNEHYTHYSIYRTKNTLADDADFETVEDTFLYVDDVPVVKFGYATSFVGEPDGNSGLMVFQSKTMGVEDVGSSISDEFAGEAYEIVDYVERNGDNVVFRVMNRSDPLVLNPGVDKWYTIGADWVFQGERVFADNGDVLYIASSWQRDFISTDVGKQIFWADGSVSVIRKVNNIREIVLFEPDLIPEDFNGTGSFIGVIGYLDRTYNDFTEDSTLTTYQRRGDPFYFLQTRFFAPLPDGGYSAVKGGAYFVSSLVNSEYYYSQLRELYRTGSYHPSIQLNTKPVGTITRLKDYPEVLAIFGKHFTYYLDTTVEVNGGESLLGEFIVTYSDPKLITNRVGCNSEGSAASIDGGGEIILTNEPAVRFFDGFKYSDNIALNTVQDSKISQLKVDTVLEWDKRRGLSIWGVNG